MSCPTCNDFCFTCSRATCHCGEHDEHACALFNDGRRCSHRECAPSRTCPACGRNGFINSTMRNVHYMRAHADRRRAEAYK